MRSPPSDWSLERKSDDFNWGKSVVNGPLGVNPRLKALFNEVH
jgi:hypothetical protein